MASPFCPVKPVLTVDEQVNVTRTQVILLHSKVPQSDFLLQDFLNWFLFWQGYHEQWHKYGGSGHPHSSVFVHLSVCLSVPGQTWHSRCVIALACLWQLSGMFDIHVRFPARHLTLWYFGFLFSLLETHTFTHYKYTNTTLTSRHLQPTLLISFSPP